MKNNKGTAIRTLGLALLLFGVSLGSATMYTYSANGAHARAVVQENAIEVINDLEGMEIFYEDMIRFAVIEVLEDRGHDMDSFCPKAVAVDDDLEAEIIGKGTEHINAYGYYKLGNPLPAQVKDGKTADLEIHAYTNYLYVKGMPLEKMQTNGQGIEVSSHGAFRVKVPITMDDSPDFVIDEITFSKNPINSGETVTVSAKISNIGCKMGNIGVNFYDGNLNVAGSFINLEYIENLGIGESKKVKSAEFTPIEHGVHKIYVRIHNTAQTDTKKKNLEVKERVDYSCCYMTALVESEENTKDYGIVKNGEVGHKCGSSYPFSSGSFDTCDGKSGIDICSDGNQGKNVKCCEEWCGKKSMDYDIINGHTCTCKGTVKCGYYHSSNASSVTSKCSERTDDNTGWSWINLPRIFEEPWNNCLGSSIEVADICPSGTWDCPSETMNCGSTQTEDVCTCTQTDKT